MRSGLIHHTQKLLGRKDQNGRAPKARADLAAKFSVPEKSITIMRVEEATWSDGCLGLDGPAESCLVALVPGFKVELLAQGEMYTYRTDKTGESVREE